MSANLLSLRISIMTQDSLDEWSKNAGYAGSEEFLIAKLEAT
jgi:hypothetical protein